MFLLFISRCHTAQGRQCGWKELNIYFTFLSGTLCESPPQWSASLHLYSLKKDGLTGSEQPAVLSFMLTLSPAGPKCQFFHPLTKKSTSKFFHFIIIQPFEDSHHLPAKAYLFQISVFHPFACCSHMVM